MERGTRGRKSGEALRSEKYRERVEVRGTFASIDLNRLSDEQLARISAGEDPRFGVARQLGTKRPSAMGNGSGIGK